MYPPELRFCSRLSAVSENAIYIGRPALRGYADLDDLPAWSGYRRQFGGCDGGGPLCRLVPTFFFQVVQPIE